MLVDIAKESSDAFPPLESCLGGINALDEVPRVGPLLAEVERQRLWESWTTYIGGEVAIGKEAKGCVKVQAPWPL